MARLAVFQRPHWMALLIAAGAAVGLIAAAVLALVLVLGGGGAGAALGGRVLVAVAEPATEGGPQKTVWVLNADTGSRRAVGEADTYSAIAWSPRGELIAAFAAPALGDAPSRLHLLDVAAGRETVVKLAPDSVFPAWSPDGSRLAVVGKTTYLISADGALIQQVGAPPLGNVSGDAQYGGGFAWSPDGRYLAAAVNGSLLILDGENPAKVLSLGQLLPGEDATTVGVRGWSNLATLVLYAFPGEKLFTVDVSAAELKAVEAGPGASAAGSLPSQGPDPAAEAQVRQALGPDEIVWDSRPTADGGADVFEVRQPSATDQPAGLVVRERATGSVFRIKALPFDTRGGWLYDVLVQQRPD